MWANAGNSGRSGSSASSMRSAAGLAATRTQQAHLTRANASLAPSVSLRTLHKQQIIKSITSVQPANQYKLLILDSQTFRFVGSLLSQNEILDLDVMRTELLESQRLPDQLTEAIYIIEPNSDNIARLIADCTRSSASSGGHSSSKSDRLQRLGGGGGGGGPRMVPDPLYAAVHVFFTGELDDSLFNQLKASPAINMFRTLKELFMDFYGFEAGTFLTVPPVVPQRMHNSLISGGNSFHRLFSPMSERFCNSHLEVVAKRIMAACSGIGVTQPPVIRYWRNNEEENTIAKRLAMYVQVEFDKLSPPESGSSSKSTGSRTEMLVVDRTIDQYAPLLHEFTYQAMAMDLVGKSISVCGADGPNYGKLMYTYVAETGQGNLTKDFYLDDSADSLWAKYRHSHIVNAQEEIVAQFRQVMAEGQSLEEIGNTQSGNKPSVAALRDAVYSLPEYQEKKAVYSAHIKLLSECMDAFRQRQMPKVAEVEQDMVMGVSSDGIKIESIENTLIPLLGSLGSSSEQLSDKLRLLLLYAINKAGDIRDVDRRRLIQLAKLDISSSQQVMDALRYVGVRFDQLPPVRASQPLNGSAVGDNESLFGRLKKGIQQYTKAGQDGTDYSGSPYQYSRYVPELKLIAQSLLNNTLDMDRFPYVRPPPPSLAEESRHSGYSQTLSGRGERSYSNSSVATYSSTYSQSSSHSQQQQQQQQQRQVTSLRSAKPSWQKRDGPGSSGSPLPGGGGDAGYGGNSPSVSSLNNSMSGLSLGSGGGGGGAGGSGNTAGSSSSGSQRDRLIIFMAGGATYSELRAAHEIAKSSGKEVYIGATGLLTPISYIEELRNLPHALSGDPSGGHPTSGIVRNITPRTNSLASNAPQPPHAPPGLRSSRSIRDVRGNGSNGISPSQQESGGGYVPAYFAKTAQNQPYQQPPATPPSAPSASRYDPRYNATQVSINPPLGNTSQPSSRSHSSGYVPSQPPPPVHGHYGTSGGTVTGRSASHQPAQHSYGKPQQQQQQPAHYEYEDPMAAKPDKPKKGFFSRLGGRS